MSKCEHCGTELIYKCYHCGAPVCCPRCCADTEPRINGESMKLRKKDKNIKKRCSCECERPKSVEYFYNKALKEQQELREAQRKW